MVVPARGAFSNSLLVDGSDNLPSIDMEIDKLTKRYNMDKLVYGIFIALGVLVLSAIVFSVGISLIATYPIAANTVITYGSIGIIALSLISIFYYEDLSLESLDSKILLRMLQTSDEKTIIKYAQVVEYSLWLSIPKPTQETIVTIKSRFLQIEIRDDPTKDYLFEEYLVTSREQDNAFLDASYPDVSRNLEKIQKTLFMVANNSLSPEEVDEKKIYIKKIWNAVLDRIDYNSDHNVIAKNIITLIKNTILVNRIALNQWVTPNIVLAVPQKVTQVRVLLEDIPQSPFLIDYISKSILLENYYTIDGYIFNNDDLEDNANDENSPLSKK